MPQNGYAADFAASAAPVAAAQARGSERHPHTTQQPIALEAGGV
jgi:hypothetical protein